MLQTEKQNEEERQVFLTKIWRRNLKFKKRRQQQFIPNRNLNLLKDFGRQLITKQTKTMKKGQKNIKPQVTKITSFFQKNGVIRSTSRPLFTTQELDDSFEKKPQKFQKSHDVDEFEKKQNEPKKEIQKKNILEDVSEEIPHQMISENEQYLKEYYAQIEKDEQNQQIEMNLLKLKSKNNQDEEDEFEDKEIEKSRLEENEMVELSLMSQVEDPDTEVESDKDWDQEEKIAPQQGVFYQLPNQDQSTWSVKKSILNEIVNKKRLSKYDAYQSIINLYKVGGYSDRINLDSLRQFVEDRFTFQEQKKFFEEVLPSMAKFAIELENIKQLQFLLPFKQLEVQLTKRETASLLAGMFFGVLLPQKIKDIPFGTTLRTMLAGSLNYKNQRKFEKIKCILHYFQRISKATQDQLDQKICFIRQVFDPKIHQNANISMFWKQSKAPLTEVVHHSTASIEDFPYTIQVDFANEYIGGGVLEHGLVQEEIRFLVSPELIISRLISPKMEDNEAILMLGSEIYSQYTGYGDTFKFSGDKNENKTITDDRKVMKTAVLAIDAINYSSSYDKQIQYKMQTIVRELLKAYVGFECSNELASFEKEEKMSISTGRWGCGIFGGDPQLKFLIQWLAASQAGRKMIFCSFNDKELKDSKKIIDILSKKNVGQLFVLIHKYTEFLNKKSIKSSLFDFVEIYNNQ